MSPKEILGSDPLFISGKHTIDKLTVIQTLI